MKRISAKPILLAATVFAYGSLGPVECEGLPAELDAAHAKVGQSANPASVGGTAQRKRHRAVGSRVAASKAGARAFVVSSKSPRYRQLTVKQTHNTRLGTNGEAARKKKRHAIALLRAKDLRSGLQCWDLPASTQRIVRPRAASASISINYTPRTHVAVWYTSARDKRQEWAICDCAG